MSRAPSSTACAKHTERVATAACDDCGIALCDRCIIEIRGVGSLCWSCASRRGGLTARHRRPHDVDVPAPPAPPTAAEPFDSTAGVRQFEDRVGDRPAHHLISGLSERLAEAGADPEDVVDDEEILGDVERLQALAAVEPPRRWGRG